jgi:cellulose synthase/poly-beta-1,6-N-acetylglucosamine synthase-like glycosyltransferase
MSRAKSLSVILPAYNEQDNVATVVQRGLEVLPRLADEFEVIVVDDGSSDATAAVVRAISDQESPNVRLVTHEVNRGYGAALRTGFKMARYELSSTPIRTTNSICRSSSTSCRWPVTTTWSSAFASIATTRS